MSSEEKKEFIDKYYKKYAKMSIIIYVVLPIAFLKSLPIYIKSILKKKKKNMVF